MQSWSNHGVIGEIDWPRRQAAFQFGLYEIVAMPATARTEASLHVDLHKHKIDGIEAMSIFNQVLSIVTWLDDAPSLLLDGGYGSAAPVPVSRTSKYFPTSIVDHWIFVRDPIDDPEVRKALAIYREARNLESGHSIPYAALGYYKLLEIRFRDGHQRAGWLEASIDKTLKDDIGREILKSPGFVEEIGNTPVAIAKFLYEQGRNASAHAHFENSIDPDDIQRIRKLSLAMYILRPIARRFICEELAVSEDRWNPV